MADNPNQPREYDVVKGGQASPLAGSVSLGGIEGVKSRLASAVEQQRIAALYEALNYGEAGLDLVIRALQDESQEVERAAYRLLRKRTEPRVKQILQEHNPWRLFEQLYFFGGHSGKVNSVTISPDGQTLVSGSWDSTIKVWNLHTGQLSRTLKGHLGKVYCVAISPDGQTIVSVGYQIKVWNLHTGQLIRILQGHSASVKTVAISSDGQTIVSGSDDKTIKVWNLHTGQLIRTLEGHSGYVSCVALSPDGNIIASVGARRTIRVWNLHTGELIRTVEGHSGEVKTIAISSDGQTVVSGSYDKTIEVWNLHTGKCSITTRHSNWVNTVAISPDGQAFVSGSYDKTIKVWNLHTGQLLRTLEGHLDSVNTVAISPDGQTFVSGSYDKTIKVWNLHTGQLLRTLAGHLGWVKTVAISPDGQIFVSGYNDNTFKVWNLHTGELIRTLKARSGLAKTDVEISPNGHIIVTGSRGYGYLGYNGDEHEFFETWNLDTGELIYSDTYRLELGRDDDDTSDIRAATDSNEHIIVSGSDKTIKVENRHTGELIKTLEGHSDSVSCVAISRDGQTIVSGNRWEVIVWRVR
jgi:WD40 repeat protein